MVAVCDTHVEMLQDTIAIHKIYRRILCEMGRNQLAVICGYKNWKEWKEWAERRVSSHPADYRAVRTSIINEAREMLLREGPDGPSDNWKAVGQSRWTLSYLVYSDDTRSRPDLRIPEEALCSSLPGLIIPDTTNKTLYIFCAVYNVQPEEVA
jgi:hypothetical protein